MYEEGIIAIAETEMGYILQHASRCTACPSYTCMLSANTVPVTTCALHYFYGKAGSMEGRTMTHVRV